MKIIYFDFETTDKRSVEIVSIGAIELDSLSSLELLIVPAEGILSPEASRINGGITMDRLEHLYKHEDAFLPEYLSGSERLDLMTTAQDLTWYDQKYF